MADSEYDPGEMLRGLISEVGDLARNTTPMTATAESWADPRLWMAVEEAEGEEKLLSLFMLGMMARDIEIGANGAFPPSTIVEAAERKVRGNDVAEGTIPPEKRSPPMTANEVAEAHGVFGHTNPSKWLKDAYLQFERRGKKFIVDKTLFQSRPAT